MTTRLTIDDIEIEAPEGATLLAAADEAGIYIPRLCSHPDLPPVDPASLEPWDEVFRGRTPTPHHPDASHEGCLLCLVEVEGLGEPARACATAVSEGMRVATRSPDLDSRRRDALRAGLGQRPQQHVGDPL